MPFYERQPYTQALHELVKELLEGDIVVPQFQRPGTEWTWTPEQRGELLDSVARGLPIGTVLLWTSERVVSPVRQVGGFSVAPRKSGGRYRYLFDGHQRLSTIAYILGRGLLGRGRPREDDQLGERWFYDLQQTDPGVRQNRFVCLTADAVGLPGHLLPLEDLLDRTAFNAWCRSTGQALDDDAIQEAENLRDRLREYRVPVAVLLTDSLNEATESFKRVNSAGTPMSDFHMVAALTYEDDFHLTDEVDQGIQTFLAPIGWAGLERDTVLAVCRGLLGSNPAYRDAEETASRLRGRRDIVERAALGLARAAEVLANFGVLGPQVLPYAAQATVLAIELANRPQDTIPADQLAGLRRWFWRTSYGEVFSNINSAIVKAARESARQALCGGPGDSIGRYMVPHVSPPRRFDFRSARSKTFALFLARLWDSGDMRGEAHEALAQLGAQALFALDPKEARSAWWNVALPGPARTTQIRAAFASSLLLGGPDAIRLGSPGGGAGGSTSPSERREELLRLEREFVEGFGMSWLDTQELQG